MCQRVVRIHSHPSCLRFAVVIPRLYSDHYSDNNSECSALFWVGYKGQAEQQTPNNILHYYVSNVMLKFLNYYHCLYCNTDLRGASEEWVGAESPSLNPRSDPVHQRSTLLLKSTRHITSIGYPLIVLCANAKLNLILLPCYVKRKVIFNKILLVCVNIWIF